MRQFEITRRLFGKELTAHVAHLDDGIHVLIYGGSRSHIGAVSIIDQGMHCSTTQFPNHRDGLVSEMWAKALAKACEEPVVAVAGIHYDEPTRDDIQKILFAVNEMIGEASALLSSDCKTNSNRMEETYSP